MALKGERPDKPTYTDIKAFTDSGNTGVFVTAEHGLFKQKVFQKTVSLLGLGDSVAYTEPQLLKELDHRHLVDVWEAQWDPDPKWAGVKAITFVMPYYEGGSVQDALDDGYVFSVGDALGIACGLLDALHYLHDGNRVLHREMKARNVMLDAARRWPYLGDLGSAVKIPPGAPGVGVVDGSGALSRPPESVHGVYTTKGDVYGVGMILLECLNGALPYELLNRDDMEKRLANGKPPIPARLLAPGPHVPANVARIVARMINPDPAKRPDALAAQTAIENAVHLNWKRRPDGDATVWDGRWPPASRPGAGRIYEVRATPNTTGRYASQVLLTARWRRADSVDWRQFKSLERRAAPGDTAALGKFFRAVEAQAQRSAAS
jgi:eukaryotic-like serine/threonine-protein kinase